MDYEAKKFSFPELDGISRKTMDEHVGLYEGYVKNFNAISSMMPAYSKEEKDRHALHELIRRRSFEFGGMRLHELYFPQFEVGPKARDVKSALSKALEKDYQKVEHVEPYIKAIASMRGPGWALLYWDPVAEQFLAGFSGEQHQGHFATLPVVLALDVWEHAYILDYGAQGKGKYLDAFFKNLNWGVVEKRFEELVS